MPDVTTGKPRPPRAPVDREETNTKKRPVEQARYPAAPEGQGPLLEWDQEPKSFGIQAGAFVSLLVFGFLCLKDMGVSWMSSWALWLCVLAPIPIFWLYSRGMGISAGADWFCSSGSSWVKTYELTTVKVHGASAGMAWDLELIDAEGRKAYVGLREVQRNRRLWDLVYNGILHSVRQRPDAPNKRAVEVLKLG